MTFFYNEYVSSTFCYIENVKFVHFKLFGTVYRNAESVSNERFFRQLAQVM